MSTTAPLTPAEVGVLSALEAAALEPEQLDELERPRPAPVSAEASTLAELYETVVEPAATALRRDARRWSWALLVSVVETMQTETWRRRREADFDFDALMYSVDSNADYAVREELRERADAFRANLVEDLDRVLEAGDVDAFRRLSRRYRRAHPVARRYWLAWNGCDVPGFDDALDVEPFEMTDSARRLRFAARETAR